MKTLFASVFVTAAVGLAPVLGAQEHHTWAPTPPMGWNSFDCFGATVTEAEVKGNAKMMEVHLKDAGWQYVVVDYCWFYPHVGALNNPPQTEDFQPLLPMDEFGRLLPAVDRFPSAAQGRGFRVLADYVHGLGLKFGIHVMRGIPRQAVAQKTPIKGTRYTVDQITDYSTCKWLNTMYGLDMSKPGAQEYYNSAYQLYAEWGVDYVKVDDISFPYRGSEIEGVRKAIDQCGRKMVLSLSPGDGTPPDRAEHLKAHANLWRISADFWDDWSALSRQFELAHLWEEHIGPGHWPDADMIPFGVLNRRGPKEGLPRESHLTLPEKYTLMTLWCIMRSPLMYGGDLMLLRPTELKLLTNREVLAVNQQSANNRQLFRNDNFVAWVADAPVANTCYLAVFKLCEDANLNAVINLADLRFGEGGTVTVRDLWTGKELGKRQGRFSVPVEVHGARLFRVSQNKVGS